ncbi:MAG: hypothetical protein CMJ50_04265 [Planctomycetaceae bacterium]|nr:hypothetical protein [Planctomycetaceae bacterium]
MLGCRDRNQQRGGRAGKCVATRLRVSAQPNGGWIDTHSADFDQQQIATCQDLAGDPGRPDADLLPSYIFRWCDTGASPGRYRR